MLVCIYHTKPIYHILGIQTKSWSSLLNIENDSWGSYCILRIGCALFVGRRWACIALHDLNSWKQVELRKHCPKMQGSSPCVHGWSDIEWLSMSWPVTTPCRPHSRFDKYKKKIEFFTLGCDVSLEGRKRRVALSFVICNFPLFCPIWRSLVFR
jgi:hypothetical protein